jgi:phosphoenolpyruvate carboxykinase (GTP)
VPISAILFGGRRATTIPLVAQSRDWTHGTYMGATLSSETTAAAVGAVGVVRRDPMAMLPFIGYNAGDYVQHWLTIGQKGDADKLPKIFQVNWFRKDDDGKFVWPGFGENSRVLAWVVDRLEGKAEGVESPIGLLPKPEEINTDGLDLTDEQLATALAFDKASWEKELPLVEEWFGKFGDELPAELRAELDGLKDRVSKA